MDWVSLWMRLPYPFLCALHFVFWDGSHPHCHFQKSLYQFSLWRLFHMYDHLLELLKAVSGLSSIHTLRYDMIYQCRICGLLYDFLRVFSVMMACLARLIFPAGLQSLSFFRAFKPKVASEGAFLEIQLNPYFIILHPLLHRSEHWKRVSASKGWQPLLFWKYRLRGEQIYLPVEDWRLNKTIELSKMFDTCGILQQQCKNPLGMRELPLQQFRSMEVGFGIGFRACKATRWYDRHQQGSTKPK